MPPHQLALPWALPLRTGLPEAGLSSLCSSQMPRGRKGPDTEWERVGEAPTEAGLSRQPVGYLSSQVSRSDFQAHDTKSLVTHLLLPSRSPGPSLP